MTDTEQPELQQPDDGSPHILTRWAIPLNLIQLDLIITALEDYDDNGSELLSDYLAPYRQQAVLRINNATDMTHA